MSSSRQIVEFFSDYLILTNLLGSFRIALFSSTCLVFIRLFCSIHVILSSSCHLVQFMSACSIDVISFNLCQLVHNSLLIRVYQIWSFYMVLIRYAVLILIFPVPLLEFHYGLMAMSLLKTSIQISLMVKVLLVKK
jgi:hypothetical protein